jgi:Mg-chelatase subunit ChlD
VKSAISIKGKQMTKKTTCKDLNMHRRFARKGAMAVLVAICLPMFLALIVMFVGISQMQLARSETRVAADAAARAATETILRTEDADAAFQTASAITKRHFHLDQGFSLDRKHVVFGQGSSNVGSEWDFIAGKKPFNAARVTVLKSAQSEAGPATLLLSLFGSPHFEPTQTAIASQIDHDIIFVIEAGGSMHVPQRWKGVLESLEQIAALVPTLGNKIRIGVVVCHKDPVLAQALMPANAEFVARMEEIHNDVKDTKLTQGRSLGGGLELASNVLEAEKRLDLAADQTIIFLGNGDHNQGTHPTVAARIAADRSQVIYCVTFGHNADKDGLMETAALITGGRFYHVEDLSILPSIMKDVLINPSIVLIQ